MAEKTTPSCLFNYEGNGQGGGGGTINMEHVRMTRWDNNRNPGLAIFFEGGPHIILPEPEGKKFEKAFSVYHNFDYFAHNLSTGHN